MPENDENEQSDLVRYSLGEFAAPREEGEPYELVRSHFLDVIQQQFPELLEELFSSTYESVQHAHSLWEQAASVHSNSGPLPENPLLSEIDGLPVLDEAKDALSQVNQQLSLWLESRNLYAAWTLSAFSWFRWTWPQPTPPEYDTTDPDTLLGLFADNRKTLPDPAAGIATNNIPAVWDPRTQVRADFIRQVESVTAPQALTEYIEHVEAAYLAAGWTRLRNSREPDHLIWVLRYHVRCETQASIARDVCKEVDTIKRTIRDTANLLGLPRRHAPRGQQPRS